MEITGRRESLLFPSEEKKHIFYGMRAKKGGGRGERGREITKLFGKARFFCIMFLGNGKVGCVYTHTLRVAFFNASLSSFRALIFFHSAWCRRLPSVFLLPLASAHTCVLHTSYSLSSLA